jgi:hypothetical protein
MKISMRTTAKAVLAATALAVATGFPLPIGTPTVHTVAATTPANGIVPVGTPTVHGTT